MYILCMTNWLRLVLLTVLVGYAKAQGFIRVVVLAGLGLAGLWMVHTLAQDYSNIRENISNGQSSGGETRIFKRSISNSASGQIQWDTVLSRDPASCARSFLCQLVATQQKILSREEQLILNITRVSAKQDTWAGKQLGDAFRNGEKANHPSQCMKIYKYCPYTREMMMTLLRMFGR